MTKYFSRWMNFSNFCETKWALKCLNFVKLMMIILPSFDGKNALINDISFFLWNWMNKLNIMYWQKIQFNTVWKNEQFTLNEKIFRQINCFVLSLFSKYVAFTDFWQKCVRVNFRNFHTVIKCCGNFGILLPGFFPEIPSNQLFTRELYAKLIWWKKLVWQWISRFSKLWIRDLHQIHGLL